MLRRILYLVIFALCVTGCKPGISVNPENMSKDVNELSEYRNAASVRCTGTAYTNALGSKNSLNLKGETNISEKLIEKGFGTGSLEIGVTLQEKTEFAQLLGSLSNEQVEMFLASYHPCMQEEMAAFYRVKGLEYPEKPKTSSVVWSNEIHTASYTITANRTEKSGNWRSYEVCVAIPNNGLMLKDSVATKVIEGVGAGDYGDWRKDYLFVDSNAYGPTKVCRGFDHQIHDQDRRLQISVNYKLPKQ